MFLRLNQWVAVYEYHNITFVIKIPMTLLYDSIFEFVGEKAYC
jgi:hypothetical protein